MCPLCWAPVFIGTNQSQQLNHQHYSWYIVLTDEEQASDVVEGSSWVCAWCYQSKFGPVPAPTYQISPLPFVSRQRAMCLPTPTAAPSSAGSYGSSNTDNNGDTMRGVKRHLEYIVITLFGASLPSVPSV